MKIHTDEKENYKKKIDKMKDDIARQNKELQKKRNDKKKKGIIWNIFWKAAVLGKRQI